MGYNIGSFNLHNLGLSTLSNNNPRDLNKIATIIENENFDVVALQEIRSEGKAFYLEKENFKRNILQELGPNWSFIYADTESSLDSRNECYAYLWNNKRLMISKKIEDGTGGDSYTDLCRIKKDKLRRHPYYIRLTPINGPFIELRLICIHTSFSDKKQLKEELDVLIRDIYPSIEDRRYGNNRPAYTFLLGDYNACLWRSWDQEKQADNPLYINCDEKDIIDTGSKRIITVQDQRTTLKQISEDESQRGYSHDYDHFSYDVNYQEVDGVKMKAKRIDAVRKYCGDDFEKYYKTVSDHIPVVLNIELK